MKSVTGLACLIALGWAQHEKRGASSAATLQNQRVIAASDETAAPSHPSSSTDSHTPSLQQKMQLQKTLRSEEGASLPMTTPQTSTFEERKTPATSRALKPEIH